MKIEFCCDGFRFSENYYLVHGLLGFRYGEFDEDGDLIAEHDDCPFCGKPIQVEVKGDG